VEDDTLDQEGTTLIWPSKLQFLFIWLVSLIETPLECGMGKIFGVTPVEKHCLTYINYLCGPL